MLMRYIYRAITWAAPRLPIQYRARVLNSLAAQVRAREFLCDGQLGTFYGSPQDVGVFQEYRHAGDYSPHIHAVLGALLSRGGTLIDVGANIGLVSVPVATRHNVPVFAFEPDPENYRLLGKNIAENRAGDLVHAFPFALAAEEGELDFEHSKDSPGDHRLRLTGARPGLFNEEERETIRVPVRRLDAVLEGERLSGPVVMKIDVQGAEARVFAGAGKTLDRVDFIVAEFWPYGLLRMGDPPERFFDTMMRFPLAGIIDEDRARFPDLRPTADVIDEIRQRVPLDGKEMLGDLDVLLARSSPPAA